MSHLSAQLLWDRDDIDGVVPVPRGPMIATGNSFSPVLRHSPASTSQLSEVKKQSVSSEVASEAESVTTALPAVISESAGLPADVAAYAGRDLSITEEETKSLGNKDVLAFWQSRVGKDPVARVGMSIWATPAELEEAISKTDLEHWTPEVSFLAAIGLQFKGYPEGLTAHPKTKGEVLEYWCWMGDVTRERVMQKAADRGFFDHDNPEALSIGPTGRIDRVEGKKLLEKVGLELAKHHVKEIEHDIDHNVGAVPGLLSHRQIAKYHHKVFNDFGLPKDTYGGTPVVLGPLTLQLQLMIAGGLYAPDADGANGFGAYVHYHSDS